MEETFDENFCHKQNGKTLISCVLVQLTLMDLCIILLFS